MPQNKRVEVAFVRDVVGVRGRGFDAARTWQRDHRHLRAKPNRGPRDLATGVALEDLHNFEPFETIEPASPDQALHLPARAPRRDRRARKPSSAGFVRATPQLATVKHATAGRADKHARRNISAIDQQTINVRVVRTAPTPNSRSV